MKRFIACLLTATLVTAAGAQKIEDVKIALMQNNLAKAKADLDKVLANPKLNGKPEAQFQKASLYAAMALDSAIQQKPEADPFARLAEEGYDKYKSMDAGMELFGDPIYINSARNLYYTFYLWTIRLYNANQFDSALLRVEKAINLAATLAKKNQMDAKMATDPYFLSLAGQCAQGAGQKEKAIAYFRQLADSAHSDPSFEDYYRTLVRHYFMTNDDANFNKYKALGGRLYPKSEFFQADKADFAFGLAEGFEAKLKMAKEVLADSTFKEVYKINMLVGELLFDTLTSDAPNEAKSPEWENLMIACYKKAASVNPAEFEVDFKMGLYHYQRKGEEAQAARSAHNKEMQARTKPGAKPSAEDLAKREKLNQQLVDIYNQAIQHFEKVIQTLTNKAAAQGNELELREKQVYKSCADIMSKMYDYKKDMAKLQKDAFNAKKDLVKAKAAEADEKKFEAEETRYFELYDKVDAIKTRKREAHHE